MNEIGRGYMIFTLGKVWKKLTMLHYTILITCEFKVAFFVLIFTFQRVELLFCNRQLHFAFSLRHLKWLVHLRMLPSL